MSDGPRFDPGEGLVLLSHAAEEIPASRGGALVRAVLTASLTVICQMTGKATATEAVEAINRARAALEAERKR